MGITFADFVYKCTIKFCRDLSLALKCMRNVRHKCILADFNLAFTSRSPNLQASPDTAATCEVCCVIPNIHTYREGEREREGEKEREGGR